MCIGNIIKGSWRRLKTSKKAFPMLFLFVSFFLFFGTLADANVPAHILNQKKAVVTILISDKDGNKIGTATGFIIDPKGIIVTNNHVISVWAEDPDNRLLVKLENGSYYPMDKLLATDEDNDLAIFSVAGNDLPTVKVINSEPKQGESVIVIGNPLGLEMTVSDGIVSSLRDNGGLIQITAPVSPGSSGSPVFNSRGDVIGVVSFLYKGGQNLNFAISSSRIEKLLREYKTRKKTGKLTASDWFLNGIEAFRASEWDEAIEAFNNAIEQASNFVGAYIARGVAYHYSKNDQQAINDYTTAIKLNPSEADAYYNRGLSYSAIKDYQQAINDYTKAIELDPSFAESYYNRGITYTNLGDFQHAVNDYTKTLELRPNDDVAYLARGVAFGLSGNIRQEISD